MKTQILITRLIFALVLMMSLPQVSVIALDSFPGVDEIDLEVKKIVNDDTPELGSNVTFTLEAINHSTEHEASNVKFKDLLPDELEFVSASGTGSSYDNATGEWLIPWLEKNSAISIDIIAKVVSDEPFCNSVELVRMDQLDTDVKNNKSTVCLTPWIPVVDIAVSKVVDNSTPFVGEKVIFRMEARNLSIKVDATNVFFDELLPAGLQYDDHTVSKGSYNHTTGVWFVSQLDAEEIIWLEIEVIVTKDSQICNSIVLNSLDQTDDNVKNNKATACIDPRPEELDIHVAKDVYNAVPGIGEQSVFTVTITNLDNQLTATNVAIEDQLDANLGLHEVHTSIGSYDVQTGIWTIPSLRPGAVATMTMTVIVNGSADNIASLNAVDQIDTNPNNNEAIASVSVSGSSGGNDGGLESDGSLAELIAKRNFGKSKSNAAATFKNASHLVPLTHDGVQSGSIRAESKLKGMSDLVSFVPEAGPFGTKAYVTTPGDLLSVSNAQEVFAADYFDADNKRIAAILGLTTTEGAVYNHTKVICDRLTGASLEFAKTTQIHEQSFIMNKLVQANGDIDYAVSFIAFEENGIWMIDNRWHKGEYEVPEEALVYNFQVWSATAQSTIELAESVIHMLEAKQSVQFNNMNQPDVPTVVVENGKYANGTISLAVSNPTGADMVRVRGSLTRFENARREAFDYVLNVKRGNDGRHLVEIPTGHVFDADFSIAPEAGGKRDALYFADGPWSKEFDASGANIWELNREMHDGSSFADAYLLERNASMRGEVKTYANLFRTLKAGNLPVDLSDYNELVFEGAGTAKVELVVSKASIENWSDQYRVFFEMTSHEETYRIGLNQLSSALGQEFDPSDIQSISFVVHGNGSSYENFDLSVKNLRFESGRTTDGLWSEFDAIEMKVYPNPMSGSGTLELNVPTDGQTRVVLFNMAGQEVKEIINRELHEGSHRIAFQLDELDNGIYFMRTIFNHQVETKRINLVR